MRKIIAEICLQTIQNNAKAFAKRTGKPVCAVVKADGYGHGAVETVNVLQNTVDAFAVSLLDEARMIRTSACGKEILILTPPIQKEDAFQAIVNGFCMTVDTFRTARLVAETATALQRPAKVHLKVNTGMNRYGMSVQTLGKTCAYLRQNPWIKVAGVYSHFYGNTLESLERQYALFQRQKSVCKRYYPEVKAHISATYGALMGKRFAEDTVRIGLGLYGYIPQGNELPQGGLGLEIKPAMRVYAQVTANRTYQSGGAGYGTPSKTPKSGERIYVLRYGYADGFLRGAEGGLNTLCMDACVRAGEKKVGEYVSVMENADHTAKAWGTISYEVLCAMNRRAERIYTYDETAFCARERNGRKRP